MLARLQKRLDAQEPEGACECEKVAIERDATTCVHNQLLAQIETLRRAQMRGSNAKESRTHLSQPRAVKTACIGSNRRRRRSAYPCHKELSDESEPYKPMKTPRTEDLMEMVRKRIKEDTPQPHSGPGSSIMRISGFSLSEEITSYRFTKKFVIPSLTAILE